MPDLTIFHTNDFHGKLPDRAAEIIAREKSSAPSILLDSGDAVSSGNIYWRPGGEPILVRMSEFGYDAMTMGNREFHFLERGLKSKVKLAQFPILSANLRSEKGDLGPSVVPSVKLEVCGVKVAVFGLSVPMITKRMKVSRISPFYFEDPLKTAQEIVPKLRPDADLLIALTHIGLKADMELACAVSGIDLIVGGHTHAVLGRPKFAGNAAVVQAGNWGRFLGKVEITLNSDGKHEINGSLIDLRAEE